MKKLLILALVLLPFFSFAQVSMQPYLTMEDAKRISDAAEARAKQDNWTVVIVIMDASGNLISLRKLDGTQIGSIEVAQAKAKSAALFKRPTKVFQESAIANPGVLTLPNVVAIEGGLPIFKDGIIIGSIGVSGVTSAQDGIIADAGVKAY
jgi:glc operon protein GlcG